MHLCKQDEEQTDYIKPQLTPTKNPEDLGIVKDRGLLLLELRYTFCVTLTSWILTQESVRPMSWVVPSFRDGNHHF